MIYRKQEDFTVEKRDMALLIEVEDELDNMDKAFEQLAGHGHASGEFIKLDNVFDVIQSNSHECFSSESDETMQAFFDIMQDRGRTPEERAEILMNEMVCIRKIYFETARCYSEFRQI